MQVSVEEQGALKRRLSVTIPGESIEAEIVRRLQGIGKRAKIKGFRPGKAPAKIVRQQYESAVREDVLEELRRSHYSDAVSEKSLIPVGNPRFAGGETAPDGSYTFTADLEVYPQLDPQGLDDLKLLRPKVEIGDADVEEVLGRLRRQRGRWIPAERPARSGDRLILDFDGRVDGEAFEGNSAKELALVLGSGDTLPGFEAALEGIGAGESRGFDLAFPRGYRRTELAGRPAHFDVLVHRVEELEVPALDDAFAEEFGVAEGGVAELRSRIRTNMAGEAEERVRAELLRQVSDQLVAANPVDVPTALLEDEIARQKRAALRRLGITPEPRQVSSIPREPFEATAQRRVQTGLILSSLIEREAFRPDPALVERRIAELTRDAEDPGAEARKIRADNDAMRQVEALVLEDMAYNWLLGRAAVSDEPRSFFEFMEPPEGGRDRSKE
ncbi:MAG TPA: trigger factor [Gammaproteobacteria bacterium]|nr:trigger factor [Gammaproteobacteria bacterium]